MTKHFGRRFSPDMRDKGFLMQRRLAPVGTPLPTRKTWAIRPTALNQGETGACVGMAWANFLRTAPIQTNKNIDQIRWDIYDHAITVDEWDDNDHDTNREMGTSIRAGAEAVMHFGRLKSYLWAFTLQPVIEWVLTQGPVVLGTFWYSSFENPDKEGIVKITAGASIRGGHAYLLRGVNTRRALAICENSWGDEWGRSGGFSLGFRDLERLIAEDGECCVAVESKLKALRGATNS